MNKSEKVSLPLQVLLFLGYFSGEPMSKLKSISESTNQGFLFDTPHDYIRQKNSTDRHNDDSCEELPDLPAGASLREVKGTLGGCV